MQKDLKIKLYKFISYDYDNTVIFSNLYEKTIIRFMILSRQNYVLYKKLNTKL